MCERCGNGGTPAPRREIGFNRPWPASGDAVRKLPPRRAPRVELHSPEDAAEFKPPAEFVAPGFGAMVCGPFPDVQADALRELLGLCGFCCCSAVQGVAPGVVMLALKVPDKVLRAFRSPEGVAEAVDLAARAWLEEFGEAHRDKVEAANRWYLEFRARTGGGERPADDGGSGFGF